MLVVLIDLHTAPTPSQQRVLALARALKTADFFEPLLVCPACSPLATQARAEALPLLALGSSKPWHPFSLLRLWLHLRKERQALVHCFDDQAAALGYLLMRKRKHGQALLVLTHFFDLQLENKLALRSQTLADSIFCGSSVIAKLLIEKLDIAAGKLRLVPPGTQVSEQEARAASSERFIICMPGELVAEQGQETLIQAMAALWQVPDMPPWEVRLLGAGPMFTSLLETARSLGVVDRLAMLGRQNLHEILPQCTVLVLPAGYLVYAPMLAQTWAAGVPVICPSNQACRELASDGVNALFSTPGNPQELAAQLLRIRREGDLMQKLVNNGKAALPQLTEERMIENCFLAYEELMKKQGWVMQQYAPTTEEKEI